MTESYKVRLRKEVIKWMVGQKVYVTELAVPNPKDIKYEGIYIPLPEYNVSLWLGKNPLEGAER